MTSSLKTNLIEPSTGTALTMGQTGQNVLVGGDSIAANTFKDAGGNTLFTSNGSGVLSSVNAGLGSSQALLSTTTISSGVANVSITSGLTSTFTQYDFEFFTMHPASDQASFQWQVSTDGGSSYGISIRSTAFWVYEADAGSGSTFQYSTQLTLQDSTNYQNFSYLTGNEDNKCCAGKLTLFNPAGTTYVKNFVARSHNYEHQNTSVDALIAGYVNSTSDIDAIRFQFSTGNIDAGTIKMYGIK